MGILVAFPSPDHRFRSCPRSNEKFLEIFVGKNCGLRFLRLGKKRTHLVPQLTLLSLPIKSLLPLLFHLNIAYGIMNLLHVPTPILLLGNNNTMLSAHSFSLYLLTFLIFPLLSENQCLSPLITLFRRSTFNSV